VDQSYRPRHFLIELDTHMNNELYIKTLFHELTHLKQWVDGSLQVRYGKMCYCKEPVEFYAYEDQPHEIEAREQEETLYVEYMREKNPVPVPQVAQSFPNRLLRAV
jgi:acyl-ACP thioesterase